VVVPVVLLVFWVAASLPLAVMTGVLLRRRSSELPSGAGANTRTAA
jgi:hypothetical protein